MTILLLLLINIQIKPLNTKHISKIVTKQNTQKVNEVCIKIQEILISFKSCNFELNLDNSNLKEEEIVNILNWKHNGSKNIPDGRWNYEASLQKQHFSNNGYYYFYDLNNKLSTNEKIKLSNLINKEVL